MKWLESIGARVIPANFGPLKAFNAHARIEGDCGDTMEMWLGMEGEKIQRTSFTTGGCETSVACAQRVFQGILKPLLELMEVPAQ